MFFLLQKRRGENMMPALGWSEIETPNLRNAWRSPSEGLLPQTGRIMEIIEVDTIYDTISQQKM